MRQFSRLCSWHHFDSPETPRVQFHISILARAEVLHVRAKKFSLPSRAEISAWAEIRHLK